MTPMAHKPGSRADLRIDVDAWFDGSAICLIAVGSHGDPIDLGEEEVQALN